MISESSKRRFLDLDFILKCVSKKLLISLEWVFKRTLKNISNGCTLRYLMVVLKLVSQGVTRGVATTYETPLRDRIGGGGGSGVGGRGIPHLVNF